MAMCFLNVVQAAGDGHVLLERGARRLLVLHDGGEDEGGHERDGERIGHRLVVLVEAVFEDVQFQLLRRCSASASGRGP